MIYPKFPTLDFYTDMRIGVLRVYAITCFMLLGALQ
jgi:hypothetical protein